MNRMLKLASIVIVLAYVSSAGATIRVVAYNCANRPNNTTQDAWFRTIFHAIGNEPVNGVAQRVSVLLMSETDADSAVRLTNVLNGLYNVTSYTSRTSTSVGGDQTGVIFDSNSVELVGNAADLTNIGTHPILRAQFRPVGSADPNEEFYAYAVHLKSGSSNSDKTQRGVEVSLLRNDADMLGEGTSVIFAGDFNLTGSSEAAWSNMLTAGNAQASDPANAPGEWRDDATFARLHSQDPGGSMDDRFDFQFLTGEFTDGVGIDYVPNSFHVFGNDGSHTVNSRITTGTGASTNVLNALADASDHLPVVADYAVVGRPTRDQILRQIAELEAELARLRAMLEQLPE